MTIYSFVNDVISDLDIGELKTIDLPENLGAFRKFLSEISKRDHKKFTTKRQGLYLHVMRVDYFNVKETLNG